MLSKRIKEELIKKAEEYVLQENSHKFSNNNDEAGDNITSFIKGAEFLFNYFNRELELNTDKEFKKKTNELSNELMSVAKKYCKENNFEFKSFNITFEDGITEGSDISITAIDYDDKVLNIL